MAGTGGTSKNSSVSSPPLQALLSPYASLLEAEELEPNPVAEAVAVLGFGVGNLEVELLALRSTRDEKLLFELRVLPMKGCLVLASGDARAEEGVAELVFLGIKLGDGCVNRGSSGILALVFIVVGLEFALAPEAAAAA